MPDEKVIAVETSSRQGSVAIAEGERLIAERAFAAQTGHARDLLLVVDALCREQGWRPGEIEHCYVSIGPGSFTGLRVAVTFARMLALARKTPISTEAASGLGASRALDQAEAVRIVAVPTLEVIAANGGALSPVPERLGVMLPARRDAVFAALFEWRGVSYAARGDADMLEPRRFIESCGPATAFSGEAAGAYRSAIESAGGVVMPEETWNPRAGQVHQIGRRMAKEGRFTPPRELVPLYIRRPEAEEVWQRRAMA